MPGSQHVRTGARGGKCQAARVSPPPLAARCRGTAGPGSRPDDTGGPVQERTPAEVLRLAQDQEIEIVDFRFCDLPGLTQHFSVPVAQLTEDGFEEGYGFDGSSVRGVQEIPEADLILLPDPHTAAVDP